MTVAVSLEALPRRRTSDVARDYLALTKPRVIVLLEVTAVAAMVIADRGWPGWRLVLLTVTDETPDTLLGSVLQSAIVQIMIETGLVKSQQRA